MSMYNKAKIAIAEYLSQIENETFAAHYHLLGNGAVESFENKLRNFYNVKHALCVDSATNAFLYLALAVELKNSEILISPLSYGATISASLWLNNKFHFADIDNTLNISPDAVRKKLNNNPNIKALFAVDFAGIPHDMFSIKKICDEYGVWYFADAAQSLGAEINEIKASSLADVFVVSFSPGKTIFCGEGACILTNNTDIYKRLVSITQHPYRIKRDVSIHASSELGLNGRINPLAAILGNETFEDCLQNLKRKQLELLKFYEKIDSFCSTIPFRFNMHSLLPAFYYLPIIVNDLELFEYELQHHSNNSIKEKGSFKKAVFELLPEQIRRINKKRFIKSIYSEMTQVILNKLYLFN